MGAVEGAVPPLFGRALELRALRAAIDADRSTAIVGEAGIGKTTLVRAAVALEGRTLREGGGFATLRAAPYLALRRAVGVTLEGDPASVAGRVEALVGPDVLFVDDLQWVDAATSAVLQLLAGRLLVLVAIRTDDVEGASAMGVAGSLGLDVISLEPLDADAAAALVRERRPRLEPALVAEVVRHGAGNPLVLEELAAGDASPLTRRNLAARVERLAPAARDVVELLAIAEVPIERRLLAAAVAETIEAGLAVERAGLVEMRHVLVAEAVRASIHPDARRRLHRTVANLVPGAAERARHLAAAGQADTAAEVARVALDGTVDARQRAELLALSADVGPPDRRLALRLEAARVLDELAEWPTVTRLLDGGDTGDGPPEALVERDAILAHARFASGDIEGSRALLAAAAARTIPADSAAAARRAVETATLLVNVDGAIAQALALIEEALAAQASGSAAARELELLRASILLLATGGGDPSDIQRGFEAAFAEGRFRTALDRARVLHYLLLLGVGSGATLAFLLEVTAGFEAAGVGSMALDFRADAVQAALLAGSLDHAVELADELLERPAPLRVRQTASIHRARALTFLGQFDAAGGDLAGLESRVSPDWFGRGELLNARSELAFWSGQPAAALRFSDGSLAVPAPLPITHLTPLVHRAMVAAELEADPGAAPAGPLPPSLGGATPEIEGHALVVQGAFDRAAEAFERAATGWAGFHEPRAMMCRWSAAEALRRAGRTEDAVERLRATLDVATAARFEALAARVRRSMRRAGIRTTTPAAARPGPLAGVLTTRERELVGLVERGLTNIEIARRLGLGRPTVARILASAMTKLGVESRAQLAAFVDA